MRKSQITKQQYIRQKNLKRVTLKSLICNIIIIIMLIICVFISSTICDTNEDEYYIYEPTIYESAKHNEKMLITYDEQSIKVDDDDDDDDDDSESEHNEDLSEQDSYLLAKIAMAEAEGCNTQTKTLIILSILNRVSSDEFPNTIVEVIFQDNQYSPIDNGRWDRVEPNEDCWEALKIAIEDKDCSNGAMYFESCINEDNWDSRSLEFLYESDGVRFYK